MKQLKFGLVLAGVASMLIFGLNRPTEARSDMLGRMVAQNSRLHAFEARIHVDIALHTFPYISPSLDGMYYHKEPSKDKIAFNTVPALAKQFNKIYPKVESPSRWQHVYHVSLQGDDGTNTTFRLVPRIRGRIDHITVKVNDNTATISEMTWNYNDGGYATMDETYTMVNGNWVPKSQSGHVDVPNYKADVTSSFSNYKLNPNLPDSVFED